MNFYNEWVKNRKENCTCDWCNGNFVGGGDWTKVVWNNGTVVLEQEAKCKFIGVKLTVANYGYNCSVCSTYNEYAAANRPDDKYVCFECR